MTSRLLCVRIKEVFRCSDTRRYGLGLLLAGLLLGSGGVSCKPGAGGAAPANLTPAGISRPPWPPVEQVDLSSLTPVESGPGIVVCEPFKKSGTEDTEAFGVS